MSDIPNTEYITVNKDGIFVGGKPTGLYHGRKIHHVDDIKHYFHTAQEFMPSIAELHFGAFETPGEYAQIGNPSGKFGPNSWCRAKLKNGRVGPWIFHHAHVLKALCAGYGAYFSILVVIHLYDMRLLLLGLKKAAKQNKENEKFVTAAKAVKEEPYETVKTIKCCDYKVIIEKLKENTK